MARVLMWCTAVLSACASSPSPPQPRSSPFPSSEALAALAADASGSSPTALAQGTPLPRYAFEGPGFTRVAPASMPLALAPSYAAQRDPNWLYTEAMVCAAEKIAEYAAEAGGPPPADVVHRMALVCGTTSSSLRYAVTTLENADALEVAQIDEARRDHLEARLSEIPRGEAIELGFGAREAEGRLHMAVALGRVEVEVLSTELDDAELTVEVLVRNPAGVVLAKVTRGAFGTGDCTLDPMVEPPRFRAVCPIAAEDARVRFNLATAQEGGILAWTRLDAVFSRRGPVEEVVERASTSTVGLPSPDALAQAVNQTRARAGLSPLRLEEEQSALASALAPRFFSTLEDDRTELPEKIMLGVQAGHRMADPIVNADFAASVLPWPADAAALVRGLVSSPISRRLVLSPDADRVAFGLSADPATGVVGLMTASYEGVRPESSAEVRREALAILNEARGARGLPPAQEVRLVRRKSILDSVVQNEASIGALIDDYLRQSTSSFPGRLVSVVSQEFHDVRRWQPAPELLEASVLQVDLDTVVYRPLGATWWTHLLIATFVTDERRR